MDETNPVILDIIREELVGGSNYKDAKVFDVDEDLRKDILYETPQFKKLAKNILQFLTLNVRMHAIVTGPRGSGKTAIVRYLMNEVSNMKDPKNPSKNVFDFDYMYFNCRGLDTSYKIMRRIIKEKRKATTDIILTEFVDQMKKAKKKMFLILDEIDLVRDDDLIYHITRNHDLSHIQAIFITKTPKFYENLSEDTKSSLKQEFFYFDNYDFANIKEILSKRAIVGLQSYDDRILLSIAAGNVKVAGGDVRIGIKVLERVFQYKNYPRSENKNGNQYVPDQMRKKISKYMVEEYLKMKEMIIRNLNETKQTILYFCLTYSRSNVAYNHFTKSIYYNVSRSNFLRQVHELAFTDLFSITPIRVGRSYTLQFRENIGQTNYELLKSILTKNKILQQREDNDE